MSNAPLVKASSDLLLIIAGIGLLTGLGAFFVARLISDRLTRRILRIAQGISGVTRTKNMSLKLDESGSDEVSSLARGFNRLMHSLNKSQTRLLEARKAEAMVELAQKVSHGLQAPVAAMKFLVSQLRLNPNVEVEGLKNLDLAIDEVDSIASKLLYRDRAVASELRPSVSEVIDRCVAVRAVSPGLRIDIKRSGSDLAIAPEGFETVFSDLLQNAIDASGDFPAPIGVNFSDVGGKNIVEIIDRGEGLASEQVDDLFKKGFSTKDNGHGLGLYFAKKTAQSWGGDLVIRSGSGETVARLEW
ncbi:MAG: HAMP domain-containing histidine kinase [Xanthomonadaceae bacterium]|nr:HAMP domain-containing histidine kinase [Xanthomonadaceae bacterium]